MDTAADHVKTLETIVQAEGEAISKLFDALPDKVQEATSEALQKLLDIVDTRLSSPGASEFVQGAKAFVEDVVAGKYDEAQATLTSLVTSEADHVAAHLGSLVQAMAEFTSASNGVLSSLLQNAEANSLFSVPTHLASSTGNEPVTPSS